jgi:LysM repeat protein
VALLQGCGTTPKPTEPPAPQVVMPPPTEPVVLPPVVMPPPVKAEAPVQLTKTYTVKSGDSLSMIAKRFNVSTRDLMKMNKIASANKIRVGQKLTLPGYVNLNAAAPVRSKKAVVAKKPAHKSAKAVAGAGEYLVKSGDSLGLIAQRTGTTVAALKQANSLASDKLQINQKLVIPKGGAAPVAPVVATDVAAEGVPAVVPEVAPAPESAPLSEPKANEVLHVVEPNQDLNSIAMMYGVRVEDMMRLNNLATPDVKVGQTLKIPPPVE